MSLPQDQFDNFDLDNSFSPDYISEPGSYDLQIIAAKAITGRTNGTQGVQYTVINKRRQKTTIDFWLSDAAKPRLRSFAVACGLTPEQMTDFNPADLIDYQVNITFEKPDKYLEAKSWQQCEAFELDPENDDVPFA